MNKRTFFANISLGCIIVLFVAMFFYALWRSDSHHPGHMNKFYIISISGASLFAYILRKCAVELKLKIILLLLSSILSVYILELILSYTKKDSLNYARIQAAEAQGIPFDKRTRYEILQDYLGKGINAYLFSNPAEFGVFEGMETFPLGYISEVQTITWNENGEYLVYKSDERGFNNPGGLYDNIRPEIVLIGDSFVQGLCVKRENNIAGNLVKRGRRVLNLGVGDSASLYQLGILKEYAGHVRPEKVLWFFYEGNDHEGLANEKKFYSFRQYLDKDYSQGLFFKQKQADEILRQYVHNELAGMTEEKVREQKEKHNAREEVKFTFSLASLKLPRLRSRLGDFNKKCSYASEPLYREIFTEAKRVTDSWGGQLFFVYLPAWERYQEKTNYCRKRFFDEGKKEMVSIMESLRIPVIDVQTAFDAHPDPLSLFPFRLYGHYNTKGYEFVAERLDTYLSRHE